LSTPHFTVDFAINRDRISQDGPPQVAARFARAAEELIVQLMENPRRGHSACFVSADLADILRASVPGYAVFAVFYRWDGHLLTVITLEHPAQDLLSRLADILFRA